MSASLLARTLPALTLTVLLAACAGRDGPPDELVLVPSSFDRLTGWASDDHAAALIAFLVSCSAIGERDPAAPLDGAAGMGLSGTWQEVCRVARATDSLSARAFFETWFRPWRATAGGSDLGLFTGYYEPLLEGSRAPSEAYRYPLYRMPAPGAAIPAREEIDRGALAGLGLELLWVDDKIAAFFLHIQGSGRVRLPDGNTVRVGYAGKNGHAYHAIGRELIARGVLVREEVSLQSIRDWLRANPDLADEIMWTNPSYVFFREIEGPGPLGAQGVALTPGRSLAIDDAFLAFGVPVWLATALPDGRPWNRLMIAQDTGGAIVGPVRGDIFFGAGDWAEWVAGRMKGEGRYWILLPHLISTDLVASLDP